MVSALLADAGHLDALYQAIQTILSTELALTTMAQLVDGIPLADVAWEARGNMLRGVHPIADHEQFCEGVLEKTRSLRDNFDLDTLSFQPDVSGHFYRINNSQALNVSSYTNF